MKRNTKSPLEKLECNSCHSGWAAQCCGYHAGIDNYYYYTVQTDPKPEQAMIKPSLLGIILIMLLSGCSTCDKDHCIEPPEPFKFRIIDRNSKEDLVFSENPLYYLDSIELYYFENEEKIVLGLNVTDSRQQSNIFSSSHLPYVSAVSFIKDFYLQLNYRDTDTLLIDVKEIDFECCRVFQYATSFINGNLLQRSQADYTIFLIEK